MIKYKVVEAVRSEVLFDSECDHCAVKFASEHYHIHRRKLVVEGYEGGIWFRLS